MRDHDGAIETPEGKREEIEQTLDEFGLVVRGKMAIEDFVEDRLQAMDFASIFRTRRICWTTWSR